MSEANVARSKAELLSPKGCKPRCIPDGVVRDKGKIPGVHYGSSYLYNWTASAGVVTRRAVAKRRTRSVDYSEHRRIHDSRL